MSKLTCCRHKIKFYSHFDFSYISTKPHYLISFKTQIFGLFGSQNHADVTDSQMDCLQGQDVTQEAVHGVTTETNVHTTALMSSYTPQLKQLPTAVLRPPRLTLLPSACSPQSLQEHLKVLEQDHPPAWPLQMASQGRTH